MAVQQDVLTTFINQMNVGWLSNNNFVVVKSNKLVVVLLELLYKEGFLRGYLQNHNGFGYSVYLGYTGTFSKCISSNRYKIQKMSKPSCRVYHSYNEIKSYYKSTSNFFIYSTSEGILSGKDIVLNSRLHNKVIGGECLFKVENY